MNPFYRATAIGMMAVTFCLGLNAFAWGQQNNPSPANADQAGRITWVLFFLGNPERPMGNGDSADEAAARQVLQAIGSKPMVWFNLDGRNYVSQNPEVMDRINRLVNIRTWYPWQLESVERYRQDNATYAATVSASFIDANSAELRQLSEDVRQMALQPVTAAQDITEVQKRVRAMVDTLLKMQAQVVSRGTAIGSLKSAERSLQEAGTEREIFTDAVASGKAQPAP